MFYKCKFFLGNEKYPASRFHTENENKDDTREQPMPRSHDKGRRSTVHNILFKIIKIITINFWNTVSQATEAKLEFTVHLCLLSLDCM